MFVKCGKFAYFRALCALCMLFVGECATTQKKSKKHRLKNKRIYSPEPMHQHSLLTF